MKKASIQIYIFFFILINTSYSAHSNFLGFFTSEQEAPPVTANARGTAAISFTSTSGIIFIITINGLTGPITGAHFHAAPIGVSGPIVKDITSDFTGTTAAGVWNAIPDSLISALMTEKMYINIHTTANPQGEARAQLFHSSGTSLLAKMTSRQEVPPINQGAKGTASMTFMSAGLAYHITVNGLTGPVTGASFHLGVIGESGPIVKTITGNFNNNIAEGVWRTSGTEPLNDQLITALLTGRIYVSIQTSSNPSGELRGQVEVPAGFGYISTVNGAQEVPPVNTNAKGTANYILTEAGLIFKATVDGLSGPITGVHFHNAATGVSGPVVRDLMPELQNNSLIGVWKASDAQPLNKSMLQELLKGNIYINFHTAANPNGEIRGQLIMKTGTSFGALLEGSQETPPVPTGARGTASLMAVQSGLYYEVTVFGLEEPILGAHFHYGDVGEPGPIVKNIVTSFFGNTATGTWGFNDPQPLNDSLYRALYEGKIYLNIHTPSSPNGEIRGQVHVSSGGGFGAILEGSQEAPPINTGAKGSGAFSLTKNGLNFDINVTGLSGPITGAHFHTGSIGISGPVVKDITGNISGNHIRGLWKEIVEGPTDSLFKALVTGRVYVNVHTAANPGGEIRGQVMLVEGFGLTAQVSGSQEVPPVTTNAKGTASATFNDAGFIVFSSVEGLSGIINGVHFHNASFGVSGPVVKDLSAFLDPLNYDNLKGIWRRTDNQPFVDFLKAEAIADNIYINFHTGINPNGEIRGQLVYGDEIRIGIKPLNNGIPKQFSLSQNYPNPFNPATTIRFSIPKTSIVKLKLYDVLGREVKEMVNKEMKAGTYEYKLDASNIASGVYFYKLESAEFTDVKKMVLVK